MNFKTLRYNELIDINGGKQIINGTIDFFRGLYDGFREWFYSI